MNKGLFIIVVGLAVTIRALAQDDSPPAPLQEKSAPAPELLPAPVPDKTAPVPELPPAPLPKQSAPALEVLPAPLPRKSPSAREVLPAPLQEKSALAPEVPPVPMPAESVPIPELPPTPVQEKSPPAPELLTTPPQEKNAAPPAFVSEDYVCTSIFEQAGCVNGERGTFTAEYLLWWVRRGPLAAPLVSTGTVNTGDPLTSSGPLTGPGTSVVFGARDLDFEAFSGMRLMGEFWSSSRDGIGMQLGGFRLEQRSVGFGAASDNAGNPIIARPVFDVLNNEESAALVAFPDAFAGRIGARADTNLWGIESNLMVRGRWDECRQTKWLLGYRHLDLEEAIETLQGTLILPGGGGSFNNVDLDPGDFVVLGDRFRGRNEFHGALFGVQTETVRDCWTLGLSFKLSLGVNRQEVHTAGYSARFDAAGTLTDSAAGGALALRTNSGTFRDEEFVAIPEIGLKASRQIGDRMRAFMGYDFMYWSDVVRPGNQINRNINVSHVPTAVLFNAADDPRQPAPLFQTSDFWSQGLSFGFEFKF